MELMLMREEDIEFPDVGHFYEILSLSPKGSKSRGAETTRASKGGSSFLVDTVSYPEDPNPQHIGM